MTVRFATILHPTDFSSYSADAFHMACALARDFGGKVIVLHVAELPLTASLDATLHPPPGGIRESIMEQLLRVREPDAKIHVEHRLEEGESVPVILRVARESKCDLIVLGSHGRTGLSHLLMGSVAEQVVRKAACPVLVVKTPVGKATHAELHER